MLAYTLTVGELRENLQIVADIIMDNYPTGPAPDGFKWWAMVELDKEGKSITVRWLAKPKGQ